MANLIEAINEADRLAGLWANGEVATLTAQERLVDLGFYAVTVGSGDRTIVAWHNGHRFEMPAI